MKICFEESFGKDLRGIKNNKLFERIKKIIDEIKNATVLKDIKNFKKLRGHRTFYRIKAGE